MAEFEKPKYILKGFGSNSIFQNIIFFGSIEKYLEHLDGGPSTCPIELKEIREESQIPEGELIMFITKEQFDILLKVPEGAGVLKIQED